MVSDGGRGTARKVVTVDDLPRNIPPAQGVDWRDIACQRGLEITELRAEVGRLTQENTRLRTHARRWQSALLDHIDDGCTDCAKANEEEPLDREAAAERDVIEKAKAWRASRSGSFRKEDHELAAAVDALGDSQGDTDA
jgi:hypothetical protein